MSRKRKHRDETNGAVESSGIPVNEENIAIYGAHPATPIFEPLTPSVDILNQINNALTVSTLVQSPLMDAVKLLDRFIVSVDWDSANSSRDIFTEYISSNTEFLSTIVNLWGFSWEQNFLSLAIQIPNTLRRLLAGLSRSSSFNKTSTSLVHLILDQQLKTIFRVLSSDKYGATIAAIHLLTQVSFVPRSSAPDILYRVVVSGFSAWPKLLSKKGSMREKEILQAAKTRKSEGGESVRSSAVRFLLAIIKNGTTTTKENLLGNRILLAPLFKFLPLDTNQTVLDILSCLDASVLHDKKLARNVKTTLFSSEQLLQRLVALQGQGPTTDTGFNERVRQFLLDACTRPENGLCFEDRGWYPRADAAQHNEHQIHNIALLRFITQLRPLEGEFQRLLVLRVLEKCPELRGPYFSEAKNLIDPGLTLSFTCTTALWRDIINLPLPKNLDDPLRLPDQPPPSTNVLASIMPTSITKAYLGKALHSNSALVRYTTCQLILVILTKLMELDLIYRSAGGDWLAQFDAIVENISRRLPDSASILKLLENDVSQRLLSHCTIKIMALYNEFLSPIAVNQRIDNKALTVAFQGNWDFTMALDIVDLLQSVKLIQSSGEVNWWSRQGSDKPLFSMLVHRIVSTTNPSVKMELESALDTLIEGSGVFQTATIIRPLTQLCQILEDINNSDDGLDIVLEFIEGSFSRFIKNPFSCADVATSIHLESTQNGTFSLVLVAFAKQWLYYRKNEQNLKRLELMTKFLFDYILLLLQIGESLDALIALIEYMHDHSSNDAKTELYTLKETMFGWLPEKDQFLPGTELWKELSSRSLSTCLSRLRTEELVAHIDEILLSVREKPEQINTHDIVYIFLRYANLLCKVDPSDIAKTVAPSFDLVLELMVILKAHDLHRLREVKQALAQTFSRLLPQINISLSKFISGFCRLLEGFYDGDDTAILFIPLTDIVKCLSTQSTLPLSHFPTITKQLIRFYSQQELFSIAVILLDRFSKEPVQGANASFMASCVESLLSPIPSQCSQLSKAHIKLVFRLGYEVQSDFLCEVLQIWLQQTKDSSEYLLELLLSSDFLWKSKEFTKFEANMISHVSCYSEELARLTGKKFSKCNADLTSLESVLLFSHKVSNCSKTLEPLPNKPRDDVQKYLKRCLPVMEHSMIEHEHSEQFWSVLPDMLRRTAAVDLEKWLGLICTHDLESLVPEGVQSIDAILNRDKEVFHRELSGWITRTFSRFTRRFAEDETLSEQTLTAVKAFGALVGSGGGKYALKELMESKARYLEPLMLAAISNHIEVGDVASLLSTLLTILSISSDKLNSTHLLHTIFGRSLRWEEIDTSNLAILQVRVNIATVIQQLLLIDSQKNSNESVLRGVLELYTGSRHPADCILFDIMRTIEGVSSLNISSNSNSWNAFRKVWSVRYVDAISSSPESPSGLIIKDYMLANILNFDCHDEISHKDEGLEKLDEQMRKVTSADPRFWLPIIAYCLQLVTHSADLTVLIENYAIGYAIACLSSESEPTRKMACSILLTCDHLCGIHTLRERNQIKVLVNYIRNTDYQSDDTRYPRIPKYITMFLSEALQVIMDPQHILYEKVNVFFLQRPSLDLDDIPMAYALSNTGEYFAKEVDWLLDILIAGLDDKQSVSVYKRRHILEFFLGLDRARTGRYKHGRSRIPRKIKVFFEKLFKVGYLTESLISEYGLGAWLRQELAFGIPSDETEHFAQLARKQLL